MAIVPNFTASQAISSPLTLTLTDTSTGSDGSILYRLVYLQKADGTYLVPTGTTTPYILWAINQSTININALDVDYALNITVNWIVGSTVQYTKSILYEFNAYAQAYRYKLIKAVAGNPSFWDSNNFINTLFSLCVYIEAANESVTLGGDITNAQLNNAAAKYLSDNPQLAY
jgi:hypothetical protein